MDKKFCIFDLDGTLVDSMPYWLSLEYEYLTARCSRSREELEALVDSLRPMTLLDAANVVIRELGLTSTPQQIADDMNAIMAEHYRLRVPLKPGVKEAAFADACKKANCQILLAPRFTVTKEVGFFWFSGRTKAVVEGIPAVLKTAEEIPFEKWMEYKKCSCPCRRGPAPGVPSLF